VEIAREKGITAGLLRPITLFPLPKRIIGQLAPQVKGFFSVEMNAGQMVVDIKQADYDAKLYRPVAYFGRMGGIIPTPGEVVDALKQKFLTES
jgi:2-oxoglutarate ferredoxin oxidoreductase subunit alpha